MTFEQIVFGIFALLAAGSAVLMILQRNAIYSAIFLILNFFSLGGLYLLLRAQFIAMVHIIVYAGAIMVLFLFVIMLLNFKYDEKMTEKISFKTYIAVAFSIGLLAELFYLIAGTTGEFSSVISPAAEEMGKVETIGKILYTKFLFPFEITSILLLAAIVGAVIIAKKKITE